MKRRILSFRAGHILRLLLFYSLYWIDLPSMAKFKEDRKSANHFLESARKISAELDGDNEKDLFVAIKKLKQKLAGEQNEKKIASAIKNIQNSIKEIIKTLATNLEEDAKSFFLLGHEIGRSAYVFNRGDDASSKDAEDFWLPDNLRNYKELYNLSLQYFKALDKRDRDKCAKLHDQIWDTLEKYYEDYKDKKEKKMPNVFISHSHSDRETASKLEIVLSNHNAQTFLDQHQIEAGSPLPERLINGIKSCNTFLLIWSYSASQSEWVAKEWNLAYDQRKKIIPYVLDETPLPAGLDNLVWIGSEDRKHAHAELLKAIFGKSFIPPPDQLFPGIWIFKTNAFGMAQATFEMELRSNGQIIGSGKVDQSGLLGGLLQGEGFGDLLNLNIPITGTWSYEEGTQILTIDVVASGFGQQHRDVVRIKTTGHEDSIQGKDPAGREYILYRK